MNPGTLLRLREEVQQRVELPSTEEALQDVYWARDIARIGMPIPDPAGSKVLVIAPDASVVLDPPDDLTAVQQHAFACEALDLSLNGTVLIHCHQELCNMSFMGISYSKMVALFPKDWITSGPRKTGVFLDARDLGESVTFHVTAQTWLQSLMCWMSWTLL